MRVEGIEPSTTSLSVKCSANELHARKKSVIKKRSLCNCADTCGKGATNTLTPGANPKIFTMAIPLLLRLLYLRHSHSRNDQKFQRNSQKINRPLVLIITNHFPYLFDKVRRQRKRRIFLSSNYAKKRYPMLGRMPILANLHFEP